MTPGEITVRWSDTNDIADLADPPNVFEGGSWNYTVDPDAPMIRPALADDIKVTKDGILKYEERLATHRRNADNLRQDFQVAINRYTELTTANN